MNETNRRWTRVGARAPHGARELQPTRAMRKNGRWALLSMCSLLAAACTSNNSGSGTTVDAAAGDGAALDGRAATTDATANDGSGAITDASSADAADAADAAALTDGQIVGIVETSNTGEIQEAFLATGPFGVDGGVDAGLDAGSARTTNAAVLMLADMMITDHSMSNAVVSGFGIAPSPSSIQATLLTTAQMTIAALAPRTGSSFDLAYAQSQVASHTIVLSLLTNVLIPDAQNATLKTYLQNTLLPTIQMHLSMAQSVLASLQDGGVDGGATDAAGE